MKKLNWDSLDWVALDRLRETFLAAKPGGGSYWNSLNDLANYDFTYAQRIGWKWDAVLNELKLRGWIPPAGPLLDWGCGSGIAGRCLLNSFGPASFEMLRVFDHSALATQFAAERARDGFPEARVETAELTQLAESESIGTLLISHVLNELDEAGGRSLRQIIARADCVLWVEPGTYADSRSLILMRESLREQFEVIAPCTHQVACGLLAEVNERHWCHHFAPTPSGIMADSNWVRFAQRAGIDLRSLPYSFLVLERRGLRETIPGLAPAGCSRILGTPRLYKGYAKVLACESVGVTELELQKRESPPVFRSFKDDTGSPLWRWRVDGSRILEPKPAFDEPPNATEDSEA